MYSQADSINYQDRKLMKDASFVSSCSVCKVNSGDVVSTGGVIWENDLWLVRHIPAPYPIAGWTMFNTQRHVQGPAHFNEEEAKAYGPVLKHVTRALEIVTGAPRIYIVAFGESTPHMHSHLVPRYQEMSSDFAAFGISDLYRQVASGSRPGVDEDDALSIAKKLREQLKACPPPA
jgi:diadenosine tetraphosphate (Ap4A) HIT family hydrolase